MNEKKGDDNKIVKNIYVENILENHKKNNMMIIKVVNFRCTLLDLCAVSYWRTKGNQLN